MLFAFWFVYVAAYAVLVRPVPWAICHGNHPYDLPPYYLYGGDAARTVFKPIHSLDRFLRPRSWGVFEGDIDSWMDSQPPPQTPDWEPSFAPGTIGPIPK